MMNTIPSLKFRHLPPNRAILLSALLFALPLSVWAVEISVSVDRNPVSMDESFQIIFSATEAPDDGPDFSPLDEDFSVLGQSQSQNSSWINGKSSRTIKWLVKVMAKHPGNLMVPPIKFGDDTSQALPVKVIAAAVAKNLNTADADLFMEVDAAPDKPYLQAQAIYTLRLYTRVDIAQARLNEPELADAVIEKLTEDSNYNTKLNGVDYSVTERKYAIFPQKSGTLTIKPLVLTAEVVTSSRPMFNGFFNPQLSQNKRIESKSVTLDVKPIPASFTGQHWLPAEQLEISQQWSGDMTQMKVGEPLTRTLTIRAKGTSVGQLPELNAAIANAELKIYPDQPVLQEQKTVDGLIAVREEKLAIMPSKAGAYTLPAIAIPWFNTRTEKMELAKIPETTINVQVSASATAPTPADNAATAVAAVAAGSAKPTAVTELPTATAASPIWLWVSVFLGTGWLLTVVYFLTKATTKIPAISDDSEKNLIRLNKIVAQLKLACADNDAASAKNALLEWGRQELAAGTLGAIAVQCEARLRDEILLLNQTLYGKAASEWQGKKLFQAFSENNARKKIRQNEDTALKPLYPL